MPTATSQRPIVTPRRPKSADELNRIVLDLAATHRLPLVVRDSQWSPERRRQFPESDAIYGKIKLLYYSAEPALRRAIDRFHRDAAHCHSVPQRLDLLRAALHDAQHLPVNTSPKTLRLPRTLPSVGEIPVLAPPAPPEPTTWFTTARSSRATTPEVDDEEDFTADAPSPTTMVKAAQPHAPPREPAEQRAASARLTLGMKRPSDVPESAMSPKFSRIERGKKSRPSRSRGIRSPETRSPGTRSPGTRSPETRSPETRPLETRSSGPRRSTRRSSPRRKRAPSGRSRQRTRPSQTCPFPPMRLAPAASPADNTSSSATYGSLDEQD